MKMVPFEEAVELIIDHRGKTPKKLGADFTDIGVPVISAQLVRDGRVDFSGARFVNEVTAAKWMPIPLQEGDVLLTSEAPLGRVAWVENDSPLVLGQRLFALRPAKGICDGRYLGYWLMSEAGQRALLSRQTGSTVAGIRQSALRQVELKLPRFETQRAIADVLGALDDKIATNELLRAKTGNMTAALFEAEFGNLPDSKLEDHAHVNAEKVTPTNGTLRYLDIASVGVGSYEEPALLDWKDAPGRARRRVRSGDVVWSTVRPGRRSHALVLDTGQDLVASTGLAVITHRSGQFAWLYEATRRPRFLEYLESVAEGSAYPAVKPAFFSSAPLPDASNEAIVAFETRAEPLLWRSEAARAENIRLARTRDELLPALMSGRITVKDAEGRVEKEV